MDTAKILISQPTQQQLLDYTNAVIRVNSYAYAITNQKLPILAHPTSHYASFVEKFTPAKQHAVDWSNNLFVSLTSIPKTIKEDCADFFDLQKTAIREYLLRLIDEPGNSGVKIKLIKALHALQGNINAQVKWVSELERRLVNFQTQLRGDAASLKKIADDALSDVKEDKQKIQELNARISDLNREIKSAETLLTLSQVGTAVFLFVGLIGGVVLYATGPGVVSVGLLVTAVAGEAASIAGWVIEQKRINALREEIKLQAKNIEERNRDVVLLQQISTQFNDLNDANEKAREAIEKIKTMWNLLGVSIKSVNEELEKTDGDISRERYQQALTDFEAAERAWNDVVTLASSLADINYNWQDSTGNWHNYAEAAPSIDSGYVTKFADAA
jgi:predicted  nucleic acid-binding Zn-ribbon protein